MKNNRVHPRILHFPHLPSLQAAHLLDLREESSDLVLDYRELRRVGPVELSWGGSGPLECGSGDYFPRRLRFEDVSELKRTGLYQTLEQVPGSHPVRSLHYGLHWHMPGEQPVYMIFNGDTNLASLEFSARSCRAEELSGHSETIFYENNWSPSPPMTPRLVPRPRHLHRMFAGDPISIHLNGQLLTRRLFIGGLEEQPLIRPQLGAVLNLCSQPSRWVQEGQNHPNDRWSHLKEGIHGAGVDQIAAEAGWVIERLRAGQRVLVHCWAGMNRSATVCCAVLILLEGLSAEAALERVRERHPWAGPDSHYWLILRWLAHTC